MVPLTAQTLDRLNVLFSPKLREEARTLLEQECADNLPSCERCSPEDLERIRFAVLKLSRGRLDQLRRQVREAQLDWRDTLMAAGFGYDVDAHRQWHPSQEAGHTP
jgi:hypothetical protein